MIKNQAIKHKKLGNGIVIDIVKRDNLDPLIYIMFDDKKVRMFTETSIKPFLVKDKLVGGKYGK